MVADSIPRGGTLLLIGPQALLCVGPGLSIILQQLASAGDLLLEELELLIIHLSHDIMSTAALV